METSIIVLSPTRIRNAWNFPGKGKTKWTQSVDAGGRSSRMDNSRGDSTFTKGMSQGLWHKKSDEQTSQTMFDFALGQEYKVLVIASAMRLLSRGRGRACLQTLPMAYNQGKAVCASMVWLPLILPGRVASQRASGTRRVDDERRSLRHGTERQSGTC